MESSPVKRTLPPFSAVRAFEATARRQNCKLAVEELCITQSAMSHQVKGLDRLPDMDPQIAEMGKLFYR